jgi:hypothetical protein
MPQFSSASNQENGLAIVREIGGAGRSYWSLLFALFVVCRSD